jgi:hypothetical protein
MRLSRSLPFIALLASCWAGVTASSSRAEAGPPSERNSELRLSFDLGGEKRETTLTLSPGPFSSMTKEDGERSTTLGFSGSVEPRDRGAVAVRYRINFSQRAEGRETSLPGSKEPPRLFEANVEGSVVLEPGKGALLLSTKGGSIRLTADPKP